MSLRNPPAYARILIVACVFAVLGMLGGAMAALFLGVIPLCIAVGSLLGALTGGCIEAWPGSSERGKDRIQGEEADPYVNRMKELESRWHYRRMDEHNS